MGGVSGRDRTVSRDPLTFAVGKVLHCLTGEPLGDTLDTRDHRSQRSTRDTTLESVQGNGILEICGWPEDGFCCLVGKVNNNVRRDGVETAAGDYNCVILIG